MDCRPQHETHDLPKTRHCTQSGAGGGVGRCGGVDHGEFQVGEPGVIGLDPREVDLNALLHGRIGHALGHALPGGFVGECCADRREVVRAVGLLDVGSPRCARAHQGHSAPEEVPGGPHGGRVGVGLHKYQPTAADCLQRVRSAPAFGSS